ncbi:MAG TPA: alpha/beta hydrolase [Candidatus Angelobacter sp.]|nr:alpha/beta hydrolase [Candidatus Angelobacter sp.]
MTQLELADGRSLDVRTWGEAGAPVLVYLHGTPGSARVPTATLAAAADRGLRVVAWSRPGYAGSTRRPGRSVADVADDARQVLDALDVATALVLGYSGGGPHALACAALLPDRVRAAAILAGVAPRVESEGGLDWFAGQGEDNVEEHGAAIDGERALRERLDPMLAVYRAITADQIVHQMASLLPDVDRRHLDGDLGEWLAASFREATSSGDDGWVDDDLAFVRRWGVDLSSITVPVSVWQGSADLMVPFAHGRWLADAVPGARPHLLDGEGHLSVVVGRVGEVLDDLVDRGRH